MGDWTTDPIFGATNSSAEFTEVCSAVEDLIRRDAHKLIAGRADETARLIVSQLAHVHRLAPAVDETGERWTDAVAALRDYERWARWCATRLLADDGQYIDVRQPNGAADYLEAIAAERRAFPARTTAWPDGVDRG